MNSVTKIGLVVLGIGFAFGVGLSPANAQTPPKMPPKNTAPPKGQNNTGNQTVTQSKGQTNTGNQSNTSQKNQIKRNTISNAEMEHMQRLGNELGLSESQFAQVVNIVNDAHISENAVNEDTSLTPAQRQAKLLAIQRHKSALIDAVLTPEQRTKYKQIQKG